MDNRIIQPFAANDGSTVSANGVALQDRLRRFQCAEALLLALPVALVLLLVDGWILGRYPELTSVASLLLGLVPLHIGAAAAVGMVFYRAYPRGRRLVALQLDRSACGLRRAVRLAAGALLWVYPLTWALTGLTRLLLWRLGYPLEEPLIQQLFWPGTDGWVLGVMLAAVLLLAPVTEEVLFRLVLYDALSLLNANLALLATALFFALVHGIPEQVPGLVALAIVLQRLRRQSGSLWPSVFLHIFYNLAGVLLIYASKRWG